MESLLIVLVPGVVGGVVLALLIALRPARPGAIVVTRRHEAPSPALINMAHIRIEGLGGLGMVAAVVAVAIADSRIRAAIVIAAVLGSAIALALIWIRRRTGALPSAGGGPDDRSLLHLGGRTGPGGTRDGRHSGPASSQPGGWKLTAGNWRLPTSPA
jgi:hypothetical protein